MCTESKKIQAVFYWFPFLFYLGNIHNLVTMIWILVFAKFGNYDGPSSRFYIFLKLKFAKI